MRLRSTDMSHSTLDLTDNVASAEGAEQTVKHDNESERGTTLVESAIVYSFLFLSIFAVMEFGLAFKDWLSVSHATREAAHAGATFGDNPLADIQILDNVENILGPILLSPGLEVRVFDAQPLGASQLYNYSPGFDCSALPGYSFTDCCDWSPCPEVGRILYTTPAWDPITRDVSAPDTDRLGVEIRYIHTWVTELFVQTTDFTTTTDFRLEPQEFA